MNKLIHTWCFLLAGVFSTSVAQDFSYLNYITEKTGTLSVSIELIDAATGKVRLNGVDTSQPTVPFTFTWGDGKVNAGWFPQDHIYSDLHKNYRIQVSSKKDTAGTFAFFTEPVLTRRELPGKLRVDIIGQAQQLPARWYNPVSAAPFTATDFGIIKDSCIEYVASAMASIGFGYCGDDLWYCPGQLFNQLIINAGDFPGGYSCWFTDPPAVALNKDAFKGNIWWLAIAHEMAHNFTLNYPGAYHIGGRIDGNANAIYSETLARIISMCMGYDFINNYADYGIPDDLIEPVRQDFISGFRGLRNDYSAYINTGKHFQSWNDPSTPSDETFQTFSALACEFIVRAEKTGHPVSWHAGRLMDFFSHFDSGWERLYDPANPSVSGNLFRSTMMVAAVSFAMDEDLRADFSDLEFPVSDEIYAWLMDQASTGIASDSSSSRIIIYPDPARSGISVAGIPSSGSEAQFRILDLAGRLMYSKTLYRTGVVPYIDLSSLPDGIYCIIIRTNQEILRRKIIKMR